MEADFTRALEYGANLVPYAQMAGLSLDSTSMSIQEDCDRNGARREAYASTKARVPFRALFRQIFEHIQPPASLKNSLEVGCGELDEDGQSFVSSVMPLGKGVRVLHSDMNPNCNARCPSSNRFRVIHLKELSSQVGKASQDLVVACTALSAVRACYLNGGLQEIYASLKPGGMLVSIADLTPYSNTLYDRLVSQGDLVFPDLDADSLHMKGAHSIARSELSSYLASQQGRLAPCEFNFLSRLPTMRNLCIEGLAHDLASGKNKADHKVAQRIGAWVKKLGIPGLQTISHWEDYLSRLEQAVRSAGFVIEQFGFKHYSEIREDKTCNGDNANAAFYADGRITKRRIYVLAPGHMYLQLRTHLLVARKVAS